MAQHVSRHQNQAAPISAGQPEKPYRQMPLQAMQRAHGAHRDGTSTWPRESVSNPVAGGSLLVLPARRGQSPESFRQSAQSAWGQTQLAGSYQRPAGVVGLGDVRLQNNAAQPARFAGRMGSSPVGMLHASSPRLSLGQREPMSSIQVSAAQPPPVTRLTCAGGIPRSASPVSYVGRAPLRAASPSGFAVAPSQLSQRAVSPTAYGNHPRLCASASSSLAAPSHGSAFPLERACQPRIEIAPATSSFAKPAPQTAPATSSLAKLAFQASEPAATSSAPPCAGRLPSPVRNTDPPKRMTGSSSVKSAAPEGSKAFETSGDASASCVSSPRKQRVPVSWLQQELQAGLQEETALEAAIVSRRSRALLQASQISLLQSHTSSLSQHLARWRQSAQVGEDEANDASLLPERPSAPHLSPDSSAWSLSDGCKPLHQDVLATLVDDGGENLENTGRCLDDARSAIAGLGDLRSHVDGLEDELRSRDSRIAYLKDLLHLFVPEDTELSPMGTTLQPSRPEAVEDVHSARRAWKLSPPEAVEDLRVQMQQLDASGLEDVDVASDSGIRQRRLLWSYEDFEELQRPSPGDTDTAVPMQ